METVEVITTAFFLNLSLFLSSTRFKELTSWEGLPGIGALKSGSTCRAPVYYGKNWVSLGCKCPICEDEIREDYRVSPALERLQVRKDQVKIGGTPCTDIMLKANFRRGLLVSLRCAVCDCISSSTGSRYSETILCPRGSRRGEENVID